MEIVPLYIAEWKEANYRTVCIVRVKLRMCAICSYIYLYLKNLKWKRRGCLFLPYISALFTLFYNEYLLLWYYLYVESNEQNKLTNKIETDS